jgi:hypothetical protein
MHKKPDVGQVDNLPPIANRRKTARVNNPLQDTILPHTSDSWRYTVGQD